MTGLDALFAKGTAVSNDTPATPSNQIDDINKQLLGFGEVAILENMEQPQDKINLEAPVQIEDDGNVFQKAIQFMHEALAKGYDPEICKKSIARVMTMLKQTPGLEEILLPEDVGVMVQLLHKNYGVMTVAKKETRAKRTTTKTRRQQIASDTDDDLDQIIGALDIDL